MVKVSMALFTVIEEFTRIRDAREKVLLDKIEELTKKIEGSKATQAAPTTQYSDFAAALAKPGSRANIALIKAVSANAKISENKAKNAVFMGVKSPTTAASPDADKETVTQILKDINIDAKIVSVRRIRPRAANSAENALAGASSTPLPEPLIVVFESAESRNSVISAAKPLADTSHKKIFIRPDRTLAE
jgi:hypothetical protein